MRETEYLRGLAFSLNTPQRKGWEPLKEVFLLGEKTTFEPAQEP